MLSKQVVRFGYTGLMTTCLHMLIVVFMMKFIFPSQALANGLAFTLATIFSYFLNTKWSFSSYIKRNNLIKYIIVSMFGLLMTIIIAWFMEQKGYHYLLGVVTIVVTIPPVSFFLHSFWTYQ